MARLFIDLIFGGMMLFICFARISDMAAWYQNKGHEDYILIAVAFFAFTYGIFRFDQIAEERGWIIHHYNWFE